MLKRKAPVDSLWNLWKRLPARERLMLSLLFYEGLTPTEAARAMGCTVREVVRTAQGRLERMRRSVLHGSALRVTRPRALRVTAEPGRRAA